MYRFFVLLTFSTSVSITKEIAMIETKKKLRKKEQSP